jgi:rhodanese-related sulfurtransferase
MRSVLTQAAIIVVVAGAVGAYFAMTRPPKLNSAGPAAPSSTVTKPQGENREPSTPPKSTAPEKQPELGKQPEPKKDGENPRTPTPTPTVTTVVPAAKAEPPDDGKHISIERAKKLFDDQALDGRSVIFIDAREYWHFTTEHITGSMHVNKSYFDGAAPKKVLNYLPGNAVVVYCMGADCSDSEAVATRLEALHLNIGPIFILKDGLPGWKAAGYPTVPGGEVGFD